MCYFNSLHGAAEAAVLKCTAEDFTPKFVDPLILNTILSIINCDVVKTTKCSSVSKTLYFKPIGQKFESP